MPGLGPDGWLHESGFGDLPQQPFRQMDGIGRGVFLAGKRLRFRAPVVGLGESGNELGRRHEAESYVQDGIHVHGTM
jgi:hypothetical protein